MTGRIQPPSTLKKKPKRVAEETLYAGDSLRKKKTLTPARLGLDIRAT